MPENPTVVEYDAQHAVEAAEPAPDPRVVAVAALVEAEAEKREADAVYERASRRRNVAVRKLDEAQTAAAAALRGLPR